jgi:hypothetical protein
VLNFASGGYKALQVEKTFWEYVRPFEPDLVLLPVHADVLSGRYRPRKLSAAGDKAFDIRYKLIDFFSLQAIRTGMRDALKSMQAKGWYGQAGHWRFRPKPTRKKKKTGKPVMKPLVTEHEIYYRFVKDLQQQGYRVAATRLPRLETVNDKNAPAYEAHWNKWLAEAQPDLVIDTYRQLAGKIDKTDNVYPGDMHPNARVHGLYAQAIYEQLWPYLAKDKQNQ